MAPQTPEEEKYDLCRLRALFIKERDTSFDDFRGVYCIPEPSWREGASPSKDEKKRAEDDQQWELDNVLGRFSRARRGNEEAAMAMMRADYAWRVQNGVAQLRTQSPAQVLGCDPRVLSQYYERRLLGVDVKGRLCLYQSYKSMLAKELKKHIPLDTVNRFHIWEQERAAAIIDELQRYARRGRGKAVSKMAVMLDVNEMTISKHVNSDFLYVVKTLANYDQNHFPERMGTTCILHAPGVFGLVWRIVRPWLDAHTVEKITIISHKEDWRAIVSEKLGEDIMQNLDNEVQLDEAVNDPAIDLATSPEAVAKLLVEAQETLAIAKAAERERERALMTPPRTPVGSPRGSFDDRRSDSLTLETGSDGDRSESDEDDDAAYADAVSPRLTSKEAKSELLLLDSMASGWTADQLAQLLARLVMLQVGATAALLTMALLALLDDEIAWDPHVPAVGLLLAAMTLPFAALGYIGAKHRNPGVLSFHLASQSALSGAFLVLAVASLEVAIGASKGYFFSRAARASVRHHNLSVGLASLGELAVGVPQCIVSVLLRRRLTALLHRRGASDEVGDRRFAVKTCAFVLALLGLVGLSYSSAVVSYFVRQHLGAAAFAPYMLLEGSVALLVIAAFARWTCAESTKQLDVIRWYCALSRMASLYFCAACGVAVIVLLSIGAKATRGGEHRPAVEAKATGLLLLLATFDALVASTLLTSTKAAAKLLSVRQLYDAEKKYGVAGARARSSKSMSGSGSPLRAALRLVASPGAFLDEDDEKADDGEAYYSANAKFEDETGDEMTEPLTRYERGAIAWALFTGLIHIFMDGTFAIFSHLVSFTNDRGRLQRPWFVELWHLWGRVDARYRRSDSFIVVQVGAMALVAGPACLIFAWATFERKIWRHALGILIATAQLWTLVLYVATEAHAGFKDCAPRDDLLFFWVLFIMTSCVRFALPFPVLFGSVKGILRDAEFHRRWHLQYVRLSTSERKRALELEPFLDDAIESIA